MSRKRKRPSRGRRNEPRVEMGHDATEGNRGNRVDETDRLPLFVDGLFINDSGHVLTIVQVNVPADSSSPGLSWPKYVPIVVRGCESKYAIENSGTLLLRKPEYYRFDDETLIGDTSENIISHEHSRVERSVTTADPELSKQQDDEFNRGASLIGSKRRITTNSSSTTRTHSERSSTTETHGRNGWILCASLEPSTPEEWTNWHSSLPDAYDHTTTIRSPRTFARSLASMVADQVGARGDHNAKFTHYASGPHHAPVTYHSSQKVFHGPVVYVDDPYGYVTEATEMTDRMVRAAFVKDKRYSDQREYRFLAWANEEPTEMTIELNATPEMLTALAIADST